MVWCLKGEEGNSVLKWALLPPLLFSSLPGLLQGLKPLGVLSQEVFPLGLAQRCWERLGCSRFLSPAMQEASPSKVLAGEAVEKTLEEEGRADTHRGKCSLVGSPQAGSFLKAPS